ncbi:MAG: twin-arginine translocase subunit TatC [Alphaproteobacteria bacterium]|nr:twin-arginine translocase subunit TatC [Alphaproteobacteria bacterium]
MHGDNVDSTRQPLLAHLIELRNRLVWALLAVLVAFLASYYFAEDIYAFLVEPLAQQTGDTHRLIYTGLAEAFMAYVKLALWVAVMVAFPFIAMQIWLFVAPGLYAHERKAFMPFMFATPVLFIAGVAMAYFFVIPVAWHFFLSFETPGINGGLPIQLEARVDEYLSLAMTFMLAFGLSFQLPVLLVLLVRAGVLTVASLVRARRYAIVGAFCVGAVLTPPDILSQFMLAVPLLLLYEIAIIASRLVEKSRSESEPGAPT